MPDTENGNAAASPANPTSQPASTQAAAASSSVQPAAGTAASTSDATSQDAAAEKTTPLHPHHAFLKGVAVVLGGLARQMEALAGTGFHELAAELRTLMGKIEAKL